MSVQRSVLSLTVVSALQDECCRDMQKSNTPCHARLCEETTKQALCEQQGCLFHLGAGGLSPKEESAKGGGLSLVLIG